jgi:5'-nucleotidase / UDP-sugar diphosphatase
MSFVYDAARPPGSRVVEAMVDGQPLDPAGSYRLATSDYLLGGGDGYASLTHAKPIVDASAGRLLTSTVINYITAQGGVIAPAGDGRVARRN